MIPGTGHRIAIAATICSLLFLQIQNDLKVICIQENGSLRIESAWVDGSCICIHPGGATSPGTTIDHSEFHGCRDISLKSVFPFGHSTLTVDPPTPLPSSVSALAFHPGSPTVFPLIAVPQPPGTNPLSLPFRC